MKTRVFVLLCLGLMILSGVLVGGAVAVGRAAPDEYSCFRLYEGENTLIDASNGFSVRDRRRMEIVSLTQKQPSSDGRYLAEWGLEENTMSVWVRPNQASDLGVSTEPKRVAQNLSFVSDLGWSPDSARFGFLWTDFNGIYAFTVVDASTGKTHSEIVARANAPSPQVVGWSPDGKFIVTSAASFARVPQVNVTLWAVESLTPQQGLNLDAASVRYHWSPKGTHLAITYENGFGRHGAVIIPISDSAPIDLKLPSGGFASPEWSPDGRYLKVEYVDEALSQRFVIYQVEGDHVTEKETVQKGNRALYFYDAVWSPDSKRLIFLSQPSGGSFQRNLSAFELETGAVQILVEDVDIPLGGSDPLQRAERNPGRRIALAFTESRGQMGVDLMNADATGRAPLVRGARVIEFIEWSGDDQFVLVQWQAVKEGRLVNLLTWARADGSDLTVLEDLDARITELRFIPGHESLALVSEQGGMYAVDQIDLHTNRRIRLAERLLKVGSIWVDNLQERYGYWWQSTDLIGFEGYSFEGERRFHFSVPRSSGSDFGNISISPTEDYALMHFSNMARSPIWLAGSKDSSARVLLENPGGLSSLSAAWAADGKRFSVEQVNNRSEPEIHLYTAQGELIRILRRSVNFIGARVDWTRCD